MNKYYFINLFVFGLILTVFQPVRCSQNVLERTYSSQLAKEQIQNELVLVSEEGSESNKNSESTCPMSTTRYHAAPTALSLCTSYESNSCCSSKEDKGLMGNFTGYYTDIYGYDEQCLDYTKQIICSINCAPNDMLVSVESRDVDYAVKEGVFHICSDLCKDWFKSCSPSSAATNEDTNSLTRNAKSFCTSQFTENTFGVTLSVVDENDSDAKCFPGIADRLNVGNMVVIPKSKSSSWFHINFFTKFWTNIRISFLFSLLFALIIIITVLLLKVWNTKFGGNDIDFMPYKSILKKKKTGQEYDSLIQNGVMAGSDNVLRKRRDLVLPLDTPSKSNKTGDAKLENIETSVAYKSSDWNNDTDLQDVFQPLMNELEDGTSSSTSTNKQIRRLKLTPKKSTSGDGSKIFNLCCKRKSKKKRIVSYNDTLGGSSSRSSMSSCMPSFLNPLNWFSTNSSSSGDPYHETWASKWFSCCNLSRRGFGGSYYDDMDDILSSSNNSGTSGTSTITTRAYGLRKMPERYQLNFAEPGERKRNLNV